MSEILDRIRETDKDLYYKIAAVALGFSLGIPSMDNLLHVMDVEGLEVVRKDSRVSIPIDTEEGLDQVRLALSKAGLTWAEVLAAVYCMQEIGIRFSVQPVIPPLHEDEVNDTQNLIIQISQLTTPRTQMVLQRLLLLGVHRNIIQTAIEQVNKELSR